MAGRLGNIMRMTGLSALVSLGAAGILGRCQKIDAEKDEIIYKRAAEVTAARKIELDYRLNSQLNNLYSRCTEKVYPPYAFYVEFEGKTIPTMISIGNGNSKNPTNKLIILRYTIGKTAANIFPCNNDMTHILGMTEVYLSYNDIDLNVPCIETRKKALELGKKLVLKMEELELSNSLNQIRIPEANLRNELNMNPVDKDTMTEEERGEKIKKDIDEIFK